MIGFAYFLTIMGISVGNFNLGVFSLLVIFLTSFSFYTQPDSQFYVWIAAFPSAMNLPESILIVASVFFPPFLLFVLPFFYRRSIKNLNTVLS